MRRLALCVLASGSLAAVAQDAIQEERPWLAAAVGAGGWLRSVAVETEAGLAWRADPSAEGGIERNLYAGGAGVILFLIELARSSGDDDWLALARRAGDELIPREPAQEQVDLGLWTGLAGEIFALERLACASGAERYRRAAIVGLERLHARVQSPAERASFGPVHDVIAGDAGVGFLLLHTARTLERPEDLALAVRLGRHLLAVADERGPGLDWPMQIGLERRMPGFSHGTAGIATFLCRLAGASGEEQFLTGAIAAAEYLDSIAVATGDARRIAHHFPGGEDLFYLGWCHGPAGTARLFRALAGSTRDARWHEREARFLRSLLRSGLPAARLAGYWDNVGQCCGTAGILLALLRAPPELNAEAVGELIRGLALDLRSRAEQTPAGLCWPQAEHRVRPTEIRAQTGFMQGAAGVGLAFLALDARERGRALDLRLPDDP